MLVDPPIDKLEKMADCKYMLVCGVAKRAREIAIENLQEKNLSTEKPVTVALGEIIDGKFKIVEPDSIKNL